MYQVLYNPLSGNGNGKESAMKIKSLVGNEEVTFVDVTALGSYSDFMASLGPDDKPVITGGDGTINRFINNFDTANYAGKIYYYPAGSGNDFMSDVKDTATYINENRDDRGYGIIDLTEFVTDLPTVTIKGKDYKFINGIGYGIDGYCCEVGDELRKTTTKPINYAGIAIKGLLFHYKPTGATITVDGKTEILTNVWLCPIMVGRYYGGGMIPTPAQDRKNPDHTLSSMAFTGKGRLKTLTIFPSIFKGEHVKHTDVVKTFSGKCITVAFDRPVAAQVDGETILDVSEITASFR